MPWLICFDVDGTLVDSQASIISGMNAAFDALKLPQPDAGDVLALVGLSLPVLFNRLAPGLSAQTYDDLSEAYKNYYVAARAEGRDTSQLYGGVSALLHDLNARDNLILGAATGKAMRGLDHMIASHGFEGLFVTKQTADLHPSKPHPAMLNAASRETGIDPQNAIMIGDTSFDIDMGHAAGFHTIGVTWGYHSLQILEQAGCKHFAHEVADLPKLIDDIMGAT